MLKALFKKQFLELLYTFTKNRKNSDKRKPSKAGAAGFIVLYLFLFLIFAAMFSMIAASLCPALVEMNLDWLYFAMMGLIAVLLGVFGSVFTTYHTLYCASDNDLLLSMPIPPSKILLVRLTVTAIPGLFFEAMVYIPTVVVYIIHASPSPLALILQILLFFLLALFVTTLTCALGWVVALIAKQVKNKSAVTVVLSLAFLAVYYVVYFQAQKILASVLGNLDRIADVMHSWIYPFYCFGKGAVGEILPFFVFLLFSGALFALLLVILSRTFLRIVTDKSTGTKKVYREKAHKNAGVRRALFSRELKRFVSNANYMLNCGIGTIFFIALPVFLLIKMNDMRAAFTTMPEPLSNWLPAAAAGLICMIASMVYISTPSISLEGRTLWILRSLPVPAWDVLVSKLSLHLVITEIPALLCAAVTSFVLGFSPAEAFLVCAVSVVYICLHASVGLILNLKHPVLSWTSEVVVIKQGMPIMVSMFGGWAVAIAIALLYLPVSSSIPAFVYLAVVLVLLCAGAALSLNWLKKHGTRIFDELT